MLEMESFKNQINELMNCTNEADKLTLATKICDQYNSDFKENEMLSNNNALLSQDCEKYKNLANDYWLKSKVVEDNISNNGAGAGEETEPQAKLEYNSLLEKQLNE